MWKSSITPNHDVIDLGPEAGRRAWALFAPRAVWLLLVCNPLRSSLPASVAFPRCFDARSSRGAGRGSSAAGDGSPIPSKLHESSGVPTQEGDLVRSSRSLRPKRGTGERTAPFGPEVFPMERRSRYETRVYANLCPSRSVDTAFSADTLRNDEKDLKTNGFGDFLSGSMQRWESAMGRRMGRPWRAARFVPLAARGVPLEEAVGDRLVAYETSRSDRRGRAAAVGAWASLSEGGLKAMHGARARTTTAFRWLCASSRNDSISAREVIDVASNSGSVDRAESGLWPDVPPARSLARSAVSGLAAAPVAGGPRRCSKGSRRRVGSVRAQPLHRFSVVDRVERSSPQEAAVSGNQEKKR